MNSETLDRLRGEVAYEKARRSFYEFVKHFWSAVVPTPYQDNWHIQAICEHLQAVSNSEIRRLVINVPFRTAKSTITSVLWPAWSWIDTPEHQWLCGSYADKLAIRDSLRMRRLVLHSKYRAAYGTSFDIERDQNQKVRFNNTAGGHRIAFGMTGGVMGDGGNTLLIDDPHDRQGAHSDAERENALTTYDEALTTRLNDQVNDSIVIIMQRLAQKDLSGHVLARKKEEGWDHLMIPMEFEPERRCITSLGWRDPRSEKDELMFPARFPRDTVEQMKIPLGSYGTAGQLQQRPAPEGGGKLKITHFQLWPKDKDLPDFHYILQSYDTAYTEQTKNDPTAHTAWGVFYKGERKCCLLLESWTKHMEYPTLRKRAVDDWQAEYGGVKDDPMHPPRKPDAVLIEDKSSGQSLKQDLRCAGVPVVAYNPGRADKTARVAIAAPYLEADIFYVMESAKEPGKPRLWARPFLEQLEQFPNGEHDDYVDTFTQMVIYLKDSGLLTLPDSMSVPEPKVDDLDYVEQRAARSNPYTQ